MLLFECVYLSHPLASSLLHTARWITLNCELRLESFFTNATATVEHSFPSRFSLNATVEEMMQELSVEGWQNSISYEKYYAGCVPHVCSYEYVRQQPALFVATSVLGLYGGLTVSSRFIVWYLANLLQSVRSRRCVHSASRDVWAIPVHVPSAS
jgi:hypothetical protein